MGEAEQPAGPRWVPPTFAELQGMLPHYEVSALWGRGGMGAVYRGRQRSLEREVAIKVLAAGAGGGEDTHQFVERFKLEAKAMAGLDHPAILSVHDFGETASGLLYIVMEFVDGMDILQYLRAHDGRLPEGHALAIVAHVLDALQYAHDRGVIHRDIKPANVLISNEGRVKIADFGLAKRVGGAVDPMEAPLTLPDTAMGTPDFVAPEMLEKDAVPDARVDLYAVGVMLYQLLTGKLPRGNFEMPSVVVPGLDARYDRVVGKAMEANPDSRYGSAMEFRADLDEILLAPVPAAGDPSTAAVPVGKLIEERVAAKIATARAEEKAKEKAKEKAGLMAGAVAAGLVVVGVLVWAVVGGGGGDGGTEGARVELTTEVTEDTEGGKMGMEKAASGKEKEKENEKENENENEAKAGAVMTVVEKPVAKPEPKAVVVEKAVPEATPKVEAVADQEPVMAPPTVHSSPSGLRTTGAVAGEDKDKEKEKDKEAEPGATSMVKAGPGVESEPEVKEDPALKVVELVELKRKYEETEAEKIGVLDANYAKALEREIEAAADAGDLEGVTALRAEKERMEKGEAMPEADAAGTAGALVKLRGIYREARAAEEGTLLGQYRKGLRQLEAELTKGRRFEEALAVKGYREGWGVVKEVVAEVKEEAPAGEPAGGELGATGRPGKGGVLRAFGTGGGKEIPMANAKGIRDFVSVVADANGDWAALRKRGEVVRSDMPDFSTGRGEPVKVVTHYYGGTIVLMADGSLLLEHCSWPMPDEHHGDNQRYVDVAIGMYLAAAVRDDGRLITWGPRAGQGRYQPPDEAIQGVWKTAVTNNGPVALRRDGTAWSPYRQGEISDPVVEIAAGNEHVLALTVRGDVVGWGSGAAVAESYDVPGSLGRCIAVRAGGHGSAAQREDGTWVFWGPEAEDIKRKIAEIGVASDLAFVTLKTLKTPSENFLIWVEGGGLPPPPWERKAPESKMVTAVAAAAPVVGNTAMGNGKASKEKPFVNSLGMRFVPVPIVGGPSEGRLVLFSVWETRVKDYEEFVRENRGRRWRPPDFLQGDEHPVVMVSWDDAVAFCAWLTGVERSNGSIAKGETYRLPSDHEWSCAAGIGDEEDAMMSPHLKGRNLVGLFSWGTAWPPGPGSGNFYGDENKEFPVESRERIAGYDDGFLQTSPVGSFSESALGLFDLDGNVQEWCDDWFDIEQRDKKVTRGGSWVHGGHRWELELARRAGQTVGVRGYYFGFRVVLDTGMVAPKTAAAIGMGKGA